nr:hypothetical protein CFP56_35013 [Quercus suber]
MKEEDFFDNHLRTRTINFSLLSPKPVFGDYNLNGGRSLQKDVLDITVTTSNPAVPFLLELTMMSSLRFSHLKDIGNYKTQDKQKCSIPLTPPSSVQDKVPKPSAFASFGEAAIAPSIKYSQLLDIDSEMHDDHANKSGQEINDKDDVVEVDKIEDSNHEEDDGARFEADEQVVDVNIDDSTG